jgi:hypothetical protein
LFVSFKTYLYSIILIQLLRQLKWSFLVLGSFLFSFKSLGLDITSVFLNLFKMVATYPFCDFFVPTNHTHRWFSRDTRWIKRVLSIPTNFLLKLAEIRSFRFLYRKSTYEVLSIYWLVLTLDPCPREIYFFYSSSIIYYSLFPLQPNKNRG